MLDIQDIRKSIDHRYPFLLVDRITELEPNRRILGFKNITINEPFFNGHFPDQPIMPGVLILEAMAQACGVLIRHSLSEGEMGDGIQCYFAGADDVKFRHPVVPGDQLVLACEFSGRRKFILRFNCVAMVENKIVSQATISLAKQPKPGAQAMQSSAKPLKPGVNLPQGGSS